MIYCRDCKWWKYTHDWKVERYGECHKLAPRAKEEDGDIWPDTKNDDFCGEAEARETREEGK